MQGEDRTRLGDPRFFERAGPFSLARIAEMAGTPLPDGPDGETRYFDGVATLQEAGPTDIAVLHNPRYGGALEQTRAGAVIVARSLAHRVPATIIPLVAKDPHLSWAKVAALFHPFATPRPGIHPSAVVDSSAAISDGTEIGPLAVVGARAVIGAACRIEPGAVIGDGVVLGPYCRIGANASVSHAILGARVYIYAGARVGQEGFGFAMTPEGFVTVPQLGRVILGDDVEIGANTTVDRGGAQDTVIGAGTRIDNLVQIAHGVRLGRGCVVAAAAGISGSTVIGDFCQIGAQSGFAGHIAVGAQCRVGGQAGVMSDLPDGSEVVGSPALPLREFFRTIAVLRKLARKGHDEKAAG